MTAERRPMNEVEDEWAVQYRASEQRRNIAIGGGALLAVAAFTLAIIIYFSGTAAIAW